MKGFLHNAFSARYLHTYLHNIGTQCVEILQIRDIDKAKYANTGLFESR